MAEAESRPYKLTVTVGAATEIRIVRAVSPAQARNHVTRDMVKCEILTADDALYLGAKGILPEDATKAPDQTQAAAPTNPPLDPASAPGT